MMVRVMQRCSHLYESGQQCSEESLPGSGFCGDHELIHDAFEPLLDHPYRKLAIRLAALILLIVFLIPFYYTLKTLYLNQTIEAQEAR
jgi:hypothetical protein